MEQEKKQAVALMRYSAIAPLITGTQVLSRILSGPKPYHIQSN